MRFIGEIVSLIFFVMLIRSVVVTAWRLLQGPTRVPNPSYQPPQKSDAGPMQTSGELHKDPVCGTFVTTSTAYTKPVNGTTAYFCSQECRDRYEPGRTVRDKWPRDTAVRS